MPGWLLCYLGEFPFCQSKEKWGQGTCFKGQKSLLSHTCTPTLHPLAMDSYNVELGWKTIVVSHWVRVTMVSGPGSWRMMEDIRQKNGEERLFGKLLSNPGFPITMSLGGRAWRAVSKSDGQPGFCVPISSDPQDPNASETQHVLVPG